VKVAKAGHGLAYQGVSGGNRCLLYVYDLLYDLHERWFGGARCGRANFRITKFNSQKVDVNSVEIYSRQVFFARAGVSAIGPIPVTCGIEKFLLSAERSIRPKCGKNAIM
jgi:hypothetical protein